MPQTGIAKDRGYSWLACVALCCATIFGYSIPGWGNISVLVFVWRNETGIDENGIAWISSLMNLLVLLPGPVYSIIVNMLGCWKAQLLASILLIAGNVGTAYSTQLWQLILSYSAGIGSGAALVQMVNVVVIERYFDVHKEKIFPLMMAAAALGIVIGPKLIHYLFETLGYKVALLVETGMIAVFNLGAVLVYLGEDTWKCRHRSSSSDMEPNISEISNKVEVIESSLNSDRESLSDTGDIETNQPSQKVENLSTQQIVDSHPEPRNKWVQFKEILQHHKTVIKDPHFILVALHYCCICLGESIFITHVVDLSVELGFQTDVGALGATLQGVSSIIIALLIAAVSRYITQPLAVHIIFMFLLGLNIALTPLSFNVAGFYTACLAFGAFESGFLSLIMSVVIYTFDDSEINVRLAYMFPLFGIGLFIGPQIMGVVVRAFGQYSDGFYIGGCSIIVGCLIILPLYVHKFLAKRKNRLHTG